MAGFMGISCSANVVCLSVCLSVADICGASVVVCFLLSFFFFVCSVLFEPLQSGRIVSVPVSNLDYFGLYARTINNLNHTDVCCASCWAERAHIMKWKRGEKNTLLNKQNWRTNKERREREKKRLQRILDERFRLQSERRYTRMANKSTSIHIHTVYDLSDTSVWSRQHITIDFNLKITK